MEPIDIQAILDQWLASNPGAQQYVKKLYYLPDHAAVPGEVTHFLRFSSALSAERALRVGLVVMPGYAALVEAMLAMITTQGLGTP